MQIRNSCADMTEEDLAKMSVNLLNCQSAVEGRQQFPCTKEMSLRECTSSMDSDMWNTYHLMNNRARAVCYAARHQQFRAMSEMTVNKLMDSASSQLETMTLLKKGQHKLESLTQQTMESLSFGHKELLNEQEKLRSTQSTLRDFVALNLHKLTREKAMIAAGQHELTKMADIVTRLDHGSLENNSFKRTPDDSLDNYRQKKKLTVVKIADDGDNTEKNTEGIMLQLEAADQQYDAVLHKLVQINSTVNFLVNVMDGTRKELGWLTNVIGGTGDQLDRLFSCVQHGLYLVAAMITCSFVQAPTLTRGFLVLMVPLNLAVSYHQGPAEALNFPSMTVLLVVSAAVHLVMHAAIHMWRSPQSQSQMFNPTPTANSIPSSPVKQNPLVTKLQGSIKAAISFASSWLHWRSAQDTSSSLHFNDESSDTDDVLPEPHFPEQLSYSNYGTSEFLRRHTDTSSVRQRSSTPLFNSPPTPSRTSSRSGTPRPMCRAICRNGQPCRNSASGNSDVCHRHALDSSMRSY
ncbi:hypothetical protein L9F63_010342 [Diploptera punctata]|uniref:Protein brambleberry n=1 Tax=Diploptera punctata TaxID=6984 RepID=A0AAD8AHF6_DIPPU|nr:hypothetical protein L9F63_010342 [Diploptera punctata]